jgi:uncharacterized protein (TIGR03000 family)
MFEHRRTRIVGPTVLGALLVLAAPAWAQAQNGNDSRSGGAIGTAQSTSAAAEAQRRAEAAAAARAGGYTERNATLYGRYLPYGGFGTTYYGYGYPYYYPSSYYYPSYYDSAVAYPYVAAYTAAPAGAVAVQPVVPATVQAVVPTPVQAVVPTTVPAVVPATVQPVVPTAAPVMVPAAGASVIVTVDVPPDADVWFNGAPTAQKGTVRRYISPVLAPGMNYTYYVRARWMEDGVAVDQTRRVSVRAGDQLTVNFPYVR